MFSSFILITISFHVSASVTYKNEIEHSILKGCINPQFGEYFENSGRRIEGGLDLKSDTDKMTWVALIMRPLPDNRTKSMAGIKIKIVRDAGQVYTCFGKYVRRCSGVLVHPNFVLTSADCVMHFFGEEVPGKCKSHNDWIVRLGNKPFNRTSKPDHYDVPVDHIFYMRSHKWLNFDDNVALLHLDLSRGVQSSDCKKGITHQIPFVCLNLEVVVRDDWSKAPPFAIIGWGLKIREPKPIFPLYPQISVGHVLEPFQCPHVGTICTSAETSLAEGDNGAPVFVHYGGLYQLAGLALNSNHSEFHGHYLIHTALTATSVHECLNDFFASWSSIAWNFKCELRWRRWYHSKCGPATWGVPNPRECQHRNCTRYPKDYVGEWNRRPYVNIAGILPQKFCMRAKSTFNCE